MRHKPLGKLFIDVGDSWLRPEDRELLAHSAIGGVVLFRRNVHSPSQVRELTKAIHEIRVPALSIAIDHEGGRVQRLRKGFTRLPSQQLFGQRFDRLPLETVRLVHETAWLVGVELSAVGIDTIFGPTADLLNHQEGAIGDRAFHQDPDVVSQLASAYSRGAKEAGLRVVPKHFPGHGWTLTDPHLLSAIDTRCYEDIVHRDLLTFERLIENNVDGVMVGHVAYPEFDDQPACASRKWLKDVLRNQMRFKGLIFSDDVAMAGASPWPDVYSRVQACLMAGCNHVVICQGGFGTIVHDVDHNTHGPLCGKPTRTTQREYGEKIKTAENLRKSKRYLSIRAELTKLTTEG